MTATPTPLTPGGAMTLAAIAATGATPRPSGETLAAQEARIVAGVTQQLADTGLATQGVWQLRWLALSPDNANMAYIVKNTSGPNEFAVVVRGSNANVADMLEDLGVGTVVPFNFGGASQPPSVSKGAMAAFTQLLRMTNTPAATTGTLEQALASALGASAPPNATVYVIGHSLGGCLATMLALYLQSRPWSRLAPQFGVYTFAAPTAGLQDFAAQFNKVKWVVNQGYVNAYDMVPLAWAGLDTAKDFFPKPGPAADFYVKDVIIPELEALPGPNVYVQPDNTVAPNAGDYKPYDPVAVHSTVGDFMAQVAAQHANSSYLDILNAPQMNAGPVVTMLSTSEGLEGNPVIVAGRGFTTDSVVDFGTSPGTQFTVESDTRISGRVPAGLGVVAVRVTNTLGTSPAVASAQFAYGGPAPVIVTEISPTTGAWKQQVTITGTGFTKTPAPTVYFGKKLATSVQYTSSTVLTAEAPASGAGRGAIRDVRVLVNGYLSPAGPAAEFTYTS
nr:IPT/TIG domain-containing protein [Streptomyces sp. NBC_00899]